MLAVANVPLRGGDEGQIKMEIHFRQKRASTTLCGKGSVKSEQIYSLYCCASKILQQSQHIIVHYYTEYEYAANITDDGVFNKKASNQQLVRELRVSLGTY